MNIKKVISLLVVLFVLSTNVSAQNIWGQLLNGLVQGTSQGLEIGTLKKIINNPNLQSADMRNYLANYRNGDAYMVTYRDPNLKASLQVFDGAADFIEQFDHYLMVKQKGKPVLLFDV